MNRSLAVLLMLIVATSTWSAAQDASRISEVELMNHLVSKVDPEYPSMAKQMKLVGKVELDIYLDEAGKVEKVESVKGNAILFVAAQRAVKQWKFKPVNVGSSPGKVVARLGILFSS
ncbi:MAG: energy transducer TonB [Bryobacterales bacterium]|nr:energy transducer TonB [Bryobacterales bacterium]